MKCKKNLFPSGLWTEVLSSDCTKGRKTVTKSEDAVDWSRMCLTMSGELCQDAASSLMEQGWVLQMLFFCCINSFHDDFACGDRMSSFRLNSQKMFSVSHFPFNMRRLEICKEIIFYIVCICICVCICSNASPKRNLENNSVSLDISTVPLTCEGKAAKSSFQPSPTSVKFWAAAPQCL